MVFDVPILFVVFNRPATTRLVFEQIRRLKPKHLYIAADGPRFDRPSDQPNCAEVREICNDIDWECNAKRLYRTTNLGCKVAVSSAIDWFFSQVDEGIILEDDVLPDPTFFAFCKDMLEKYRYDEKVMHISGFNILGTWKAARQSWHFSYFGTIWGWATWKRSWSKYDVSIGKWNEVAVQEHILKTYFPESVRANRKALYDELYAGKIDTWDYQWTFCRLLEGGYSIIPSVNLVTNIGFDQHATHTSVAPSWLPKKLESLRTPYKAPGKVAVDREFDDLHLKSTIFGAGRSGGFRSGLQKLKSALKKYVLFILDGKNETTHGIS